MTTSPEAVFLTVAEFGKRIGVGRATAYRLVPAGRVDVVDVAVKGRPRLRISEQALIEFARRNQVRA